MHPPCKGGKRKREIILLDRLYDSIFTYLHLNDKYKCLQINFCPSVQEYMVQMYLAVHSIYIIIHNMHEKVHFQLHTREKAFVNIFLRAIADVAENILLRSWKYVNYSNCDVIL